MQARSGSSESEAMQGIVDDTEEKSQKDIVVTSSKPSKPINFPTKGTLKHKLKNCQKIKSKEKTKKNGQKNFLSSKKSIFLNSAM